MEILKKGKNNTLRKSVRWRLFFYDLFIFIIVSGGLLYLHPSDIAIPFRSAVSHGLIGCICIFLSRFTFRIYRQIWRYGNVVGYLKLLFADSIGYLLWFIVERISFISHIRIILTFSIAAVNLLASISMRLLYVYLYDRASKHPSQGIRNLFTSVVKCLGNVNIRDEYSSDIGNTARKIRIAIIGAGRLGLSLAEDINSNENNIYDPVCFVDTEGDKSGRYLDGIPVFSQNDATPEFMSSMAVQEIVFALPKLTSEQKLKLVEYYKPSNCKIKVYDYPALEGAERKRQLREFDIEELLFRRPIKMTDEKTESYYKDKTVMVTGGGGSIGSEICRQLAKMGAGKIIIVDICENGAYDIQQELKMSYSEKPAVYVSIVSVVNATGLERAFAEYKPQIVIMAAAHKHVPFMEKDCIEAVENNVFGTLNTVNLAEKYHAEKVILVSSDKAVNPTNVMGATKRVCEMIVMSRAKSNDGVAGKPAYSATRFGNVLGSAGSVIPLFKKQIAKGGPVTVTDKRIIRYFMTIPEASQLVLQSGALAKNGELFVLDMGKPVRIYDLADNMIRLSGLRVGTDIEIVETGLRPGEKLYEELLMQSETLTQTENSLIFIEKDESLSDSELNIKLSALSEAVKNNKNTKVKDVLKKVVPTYVPSADNSGNDTRFKATGDEISSILKGKRILVVDDIELNRNSIVETLDIVGIKADSASGGKDALNLLLSVDPDYYDFVLMDIVMPELDGFESAKLIKNESIFSSLPIIAMSAETIEHIERKLEDSVFCDFITKPIHIDDLFAILIKHNH